MSSRDEVDDVAVCKGLHLATAYEDDDDKIFTVADLVDGCLVNPPPNVQFDVEGGVQLIHGIRWVNEEGEALLRPRVIGAVTVCAMTSVGDPAACALRFVHLSTQGPMASRGERFSASHGGVPDVGGVNIDAFARPIQLFWRKWLDTSGAWHVSDWTQ